MAGQTISLIQMGKMKKDSVCSQLPDIPSGDWQTLKDVFVGKAPDQMFSFSNAQIINYFVVRTAVDWQTLKDVFVGKAPDQMFSFSNTQIINYFMVRTAVDGMPVSDTVKRLYFAGHIFREFRESPFNSEINFQRILLHHQSVYLRNS